MDSVTLNASSNHIATCLWVRTERIDVAWLNLRVVVLFLTKLEMGPKGTINFAFIAVLRSFQMYLISINLNEQIKM